MADPFSIRDMVIQQLAPADIPALTGLLDVYRDAFGLTDFIAPPAGHLARLLDDPAMIFLVASHHHKVIGGLTAYILPSVYYPASEAYLYDLAVMTEYQRQGIGTALLAALKAQCARQGIREIFVQADRPDQHAIEFYSRNGGIPEDVIHFSFPNLSGK